MQSLGVVGLDVGAFFISPVWNLLTTVQEGGQGTFVVDDVNSSVSV